MWRRYGNDKDFISIIMDGSYINPIVDNQCNEFFLSKIENKTFFFMFLMKKIFIDIEKYFFSRAFGMSIFYWVKRGLR